MQRSGSLVSLMAGAFLGVAALPGIAHAELKIGIVNFNKLADESPQAKALQATLQREFGQRQKDLAQQQGDLKTKAEKFQRDSAIMAEAERTKAQRELVDLQRDLQRRENEFKEDFELRRNEELGKLQRSLVNETQAYAKAQGYDLVLSGDTVIFRKDAIDITSAVVGAIHEKNSKAAGPGATAPKP